MGMMPEIFNRTVVINGIALDCWDEDATDTKAFCRTGRGGGIDPTCSPGGGGRGSSQQSSDENPLVPAQHGALERARALKDARKAQKEREGVRYQDQYEDAVNHHSKRTTAIQKKIAKLWDRDQALLAIYNEADKELKALFDTPYEEQNEAQIAHVQKKVSKAKEKYLKPHDELLQEVGKLLRSGTKDPAQSIVTGSVATLYPKPLEAVGQASFWMLGLLSEKHSQTVSTTNIVHAMAARSSYDEDTSTIHLSGFFYSPEVVMHELGHAIEDKNGTVHGLCAGFLTKRTRGENPEPMGGGYENYEVGWQDDFGKAHKNPRYVGKHYPSGGTEILSMGIEQMVRDPIGFAKNDPEHFILTLGILNGEMLE